MRNDYREGRSFAQADGMRSTRRPEDVASIMRMAANDEPVRLHSILIERLTVDAMVLADEVETYFGAEAFEAETTLDAAQQALVKRAGLRLSRLVNALVEALARGESLAGLDSTPVEDPGCVHAEVGALPPHARALVEATRALIERIDEIRSPDGTPRVLPSPARALQAFLAEQLGLQSD